MTEPILTPPSESPSLSPTTTAQQDLITARQSRINLIWEWTQAIVAIMITAAFILTTIRSIQSSPVNIAFGTIIGFYFSRTNHQAIGGLGPKANLTQVYDGR